MPTLIWSTSVYPRTLKTIMELKYDQLGCFILRKRYSIPFRNQERPPTSFLEGNSEILRRDSVICSQMSICQFVGKIFSQRFLQNVLRDFHFVRKYEYWQSYTQYYSHKQEAMVKKIGPTTESTENAKN